MSLREELSHIKVAETKTYKDAEVYQMLLKNMYKIKIKDVVIGQYQSGEREIKSNFQFAFQMYIDRNEEAKYRTDSAVYGLKREYDRYQGYIYFQNLYTMEKLGGQLGTSKKRIILTSLGRKVYQDLKRLAETDGVILSEPLCHYHTEYTSFGSKKMYSCEPKLGEYFLGKDPGHYRNSHDYSVDISFKFKV